MAQFDTCSICDYNKAQGSTLANVLPNTNGSVRRHKDKFYCDVCFSKVVENYYDLTEDDEETKIVSSFILDSEFDG